MLILLVLLPGPMVLVGIFLLYRWAKKKEKPAPRWPLPGPMSVPRERTTGVSYGASDGSLGFEVPPLAGAPKSVGGGAYQEASEREMPPRERFSAREKARARQRRQTAAKRETMMEASPAAGRPAPSFTPATLANAVVLAEILAPPKALRRHRSS